MVDAKRARMNVEAFYMDANVDDVLGVIESASLIGESFISIDADRLNQRQVVKLRKLDFEVIHWSRDTSKYFTIRW